MTLRRLAVLGALALAAPAAGLVTAQAAVAAAPADRSATHDGALLAAIVSNDRPEADRKRDPWRDPAETLEFWGLKPGLTVIDLQPGGGYWTNLLAPYAMKTHGRYIAGGGPGGRDAFLAKFADKSKFGDVTYATFNKTSGPFVPPDSADLVISSREIHNWMQGQMLDKAMADVFAALKPGGVFGVEEHRWDGAPASVKSDGSAGYVKTADVIAAAQKAGFKLAAKSEILTNHKDDKNHPFGVWTLPPSRQSTPDGKTQDPAFDHAKYDAIGESDRMTLRFVKPKA